MLSNLANLYARRDLLRELIVSNMKASTAETKLGWFWWLLDPAMMILIYWLIKIIILGRDRYEPYLIFVGCALICWKHLSSSVNGSVKVLRSKQGLIKSIPFPTIILPVSQVSTQFIYFLFAFALLFVAAIALGQPMTVKLVQIIPLMVLQFMLILGLAMGLACFGVLIRDLESVTTHVLRVCWYLSPGIYGIDLVAHRLIGDPERGGGLADDWIVSGELLLQLYQMNPFAILFQGYRHALFDPQWLPTWLWITLIVQAIVLLVIGYIVYTHYDRRVIKFI